jgi:acetyl esterase/lipase
MLLSDLSFAERIFQRSHMATACGGVKYCDRNEETVVIPGPIPADRPLEMPFVDPVMVCSLKPGSLSSSLLVICRLCVLAVRYWIHYIGVPFANYYNFSHIAADGVRSNEGVIISRHVVYGELDGESMDILQPNGKYHKLDESIVYIHGGGFVSVHRGVMNHSVTPLVRAGYTVYSIDYPLAPKYQFPIPVLSIIKCLGHLKEKHGITRVRLIADSAGGCLASMAVGAIHNPNREWTDEIRSAVLSTDLPLVEGLVLIYSLCDEDSWRPSSDQSIAHRIQNNILHFCLSQYRASDTDKITIFDHCDKLNSFPPTLLLCGESDPLKESHAVFYQKLVSMGFDATNIVLPGFHGFHGLPPPFSFGLWRKTVFPANCALIKWLSSGSEERVPVLPPISWRDYDLHLLIVLFFAHVSAALITASAINHFVNIH